MQNYGKISVITKYYGKISLIIITTQFRLNFNVTDT